MDFIKVDGLDEALAAKAARPEAVPICGGTDLMVDLNFARRRPEAVLDLAGVADLEAWAADDGALRVGAGVTYARLIDELGDRLPGLAIASRTVGSPQIRNRGTVGGNLGTASPAGDALPPLYAAGATVEVASTRGRRTLPIEAFVTGPKRTALEPDELITAVLVPAPDGPEQFAKVGTRNAMVIAVCSFALALHPAEGRVGACIGSAGPTPIRAGEAEAFLAGVLAEEDARERRTPLAGRAVARFGDLVAQAAAPIDDVRGSAAYRRHAVGVLARRTLQWAWDEWTRRG